MILVDSCVLIDVFESSAVWKDWSLVALNDCKDEGLRINAMIYAEVAPSFKNSVQFDRTLAELSLIYSDINSAAAWRAAQAYEQYRQNKGAQKMILPDFYIGAQAEVMRWAVLTRDQSRFRTYFPVVRLIAPDTNALRIQ
jgi:predicted nucleic acid-binding protein